MYTLQSINRGRNFPSVAYFSSTPPIRSLRTPLAILVNQGTASAAEIVSGAVQVMSLFVYIFPPYIDTYQNKPPPIHNLTYTYTHICTPT